MSQVTLPARLAFPEAHFPHRSRPLATKGMQRALSLVTAGSGNHSSSLRRSLQVIQLGERCQQHGTVQLRRTSANRTSHMRRTWHARAAAPGLPSCASDLPPQHNLTHVNTLQTNLSLKTTWNSNPKPSLETASPCPAPHQSKPARPRPSHPPSPSPPSPPTTPADSHSPPYRPPPPTTRTPPPPQTTTAAGTACSA